MSVDKPSLVNSLSAKKPTDLIIHRLIQNTYGGAKSMPVLNPKTGEQDYVDLELVSKINIEPQFLHNFSSREREKVRFGLEGIKEEEKVLFQAFFEDDTTFSHEFGLLEFKKAMADCIYDAMKKRLEHTDMFIAAADQMIDQYIEKMKQANILCCRLDKNHLLDGGIGVITDLKTNQDVGTFESLKFNMAKNNDEVFFDVLDILSSVRQIRDYLPEPERFKYTYYSLRDHLIYTMIPDEGTRTQRMEHASDAHSDQNVRFHQVSLSIKPLEEDDTHMQMVMDAVETKVLIKDLAPDDFLSSQAVEAYKAARIKILIDSEERSKKQQMLSKYADIEI